MDISGKEIIDVTAHLLHMCVQLERAVIIFF